MDVKTLHCLCLLFCLIQFPFLMNGQSAFRTIDGSNNNTSNPEMGATHAPLRQLTSVGFEDGIALPSLPNNPNPRTVSNAVFFQDGLLNDPLELSDFTWVFGQFLDHDITLVGDDATSPITINVPSGDQWFDPFFQGTAIIPMFRSLPHSGSGEGIGNPRTYSNEITHWIDGSNIYGSDIQRASWLRTFEGGKMKTSEGNLLPYNTVDGELNSPIDNNAPFMDNPVGAESVIFVAGDARANENILLISMHTLFVREHNRICDEINTESPGMADEIIYQTARKKVGALFQSIVYNEWLPAMGVHLPPYEVYDPSVDPSITNVFSAAAFRMGHTLLNSNIMRIGFNGEEIPEGNATLQEAFFRPSLIQEGGISPLFRGMGIQMQQDMDGKIVDDVRNFLFGPPGAGGLDLAAINIQRGRERGLSDFNTIRGDYELQTFTSFDGINPNPNVYEALENLYDSVDDIDPWVGMLVEEHMPGALVGETIMAILIQQFQALRDGDRFFYKDDPLLALQDIEEIENTTLADIITRNTDIVVMQDNVFEAMPHSQLCPASGPTANLVVNVETENGQDIENATVIVNNGGGTVSTILSSPNGISNFDLGTCDDYEVTASKNINPSNGVTALDLALIQRHILEITPLDSPYKLIAADINNSGSITTLDIVQAQQLILGLIPEFFNNPSWKFIDADFDFNTPNNPFTSNISLMEVNEFLDDTTVDYIGIKIGDVNGSVNLAEINSGIALRNATPMTMSLPNRIFEKGESFQIQVTNTNLSEVIGYQFTLNYGTVLTLDEIIPGAIDQLTQNNFAHFQDQNKLTSVWSGNEKRNEATVLFTLNFTAKKAGELKNQLQLSSDITKAEAYNQQLKAQPIQLIFKDTPVELTDANNIKLYQNTPNPFIHQTTIGFVLPENGDANITIYNVDGSTVKTFSDTYEKGYHEVVLDKTDLNENGLLYYTLSSEYGTATRKMILINRTIP